MGEIVGFFLLYGIGKKFNKNNIGLYRNGGLACFKKNNGHQNDKLGKSLLKLFKYMVWN